MDTDTLTFEERYRISSGRDARFDGMFVMAVRSTGIYCRPSCPARTPKRANASFYSTPAGAMADGYRACKRCHPDATPGSPEWSHRQDVGARAMRLILDGVVDRDGVSGLAARLHYSERQLNRYLVAEFGVGAAALARTQRAFTARTLLTSTTMSMVDVAFASGFSSVRQFNDTVREVFDATPTELRGTRRRAVDAPSGTQRIRLAVREPFAWDEFLAFMSARAIRPLEEVTDETYSRTVLLPRGRGTIELRRTVGGVDARLALDDSRDLATAVSRCRSMLDADADPVAIDRVLATVPPIAGSVRAAPGLRSPNVWHPFEAVVRAVCTQGIAVGAGVAMIERIAGAIGADAVIDPEVMAAVDPEALPISRRSAAALVDAAQRIAAGEISLDPGAERAETTRQLESIPGIGPWTSGYVAMRGLGDPDVALGGDLIVRRSRDRWPDTGSGADSGADSGTDDRVGSPWRSYLVHHVWRLHRLATQQPQEHSP